RSHACRELGESRGRRGNCARAGQAGADVLGGAGIFGTEHSGDSARSRRTVARGGPAITGGPHLRRLARRGAEGRAEAGRRGAWTRSLPFGGDRPRRPSVGSRYRPARTDGGGDAGCGPQRAAAVALDRFVQASRRYLWLLDAREEWPALPVA